jgi:thiamine biosynthesis lipoprotein
MKLAQGAGRHFACLAPALLFALAGCDSRTAPVTELSGMTMGSHYSVKLGVVPPDTDPKALSGEIRQLLEDIEQVASTWRPSSQLSRLNTSTETRQEVSDTLRDLVELGIRSCQETAGALDITTGKLIDAWGFGPAPAPEKPLPQDLIDTLRAESGCDTLSLDGNMLTRKTGAHINVNAITQGYAAERIAAMLDARQVSSYLIDMSGELVARGRKPDGSAWKIGIEVPERGGLPGAEGGALHKIIELSEMSIATSGDYRNFHMLNGEMINHVLDPHTGRPTHHALASVTVLATSVAHADALSTALLVMGPERGVAFAREHGLAALFIIRDGESFREEATPAFIAYPSSRGDVP